MTYDERLHAAAQAWAAAYRARQEASSIKRRTFAATRARDHRFGGLSAEVETSAQVTEARAALRAAEKALLQIVDPKPITLKARAREVKDGPVLLIER